MKGFYLLGDMGSGNNDQKKVANSLTEHIHKLTQQHILSFYYIQTYQTFLILDTVQTNF